MTQEHKVVEENTLHVNKKESVLFLLAGKAVDTAQKWNLLFALVFSKMCFKHKIKADMKEALICMASI